MKSYCLEPELWLKALFIPIWIVVVGRCGIPRNCKASVLSGEHELFDCLIGSSRSFMEYLSCRVTSPIPDLQIKLPVLHAKLISYRYFYFGWKMVTLAQISLCLIDLRHYCPFS